MHGKHFKARMMVTILGACLACLALAAPALAQSTLQSGYAPPGGQVQSQVGTQQPTSQQQPASQASPSTRTTLSPTPTNHVEPSVTTKPTKSSSGTLPFTGLDVGILAGLGVLFLAGGLALRLIPRRRRQQR